MEMGRWFLSLCFLLSLSCGSKNSKGLEIQENKSIIEGLEVNSADPIAKHTVLIHFYQKANLVDPKPRTIDTCTGVIVSAKSILTAAHCFENPDKNKKNFIEVYFAQSGEDTEKLIKEKRMINGIMFTPHPYSNLESPQHFDLAMITLPEPIPAGFEPVPLLPNDVELKAGDIVIPAGFGRRVDSVADKNSKLNRSIGIKIQQDWGTSFYVDQTGGSGLCSGDSGGPAFHQSKGKLFLAGINHGVYSPGVESGKMSCRYRGTIVKVQTHKAWILKNLKN